MKLVKVISKSNIYANFDGSETSYTECGGKIQIPEYLRNFSLNSHYKTVFAFNICVIRYRCDTK